MTTRYNAWTDPELAYLRDGDVGLLAVADAAATVPRFAVPKRRQRARLATRASVAAVVIAVGILTATPAFGLRTLAWSFIAGTPVAVDSLSNEDWAMLSDVNSAIANTNIETPASTAQHSLTASGFAAILLVATRGGQAFYVLRRTDGSTCFSTGAASGQTPPDGSTPGAPQRLLGMAACPAEMSPSFPSKKRPILDLSVFHTINSTGGPGVTGTPYIWRLSGFAADPVARVAVRGLDGLYYESTKVSQNIYDAEDLAPIPAKAIVAFDSAGKVVYSECVSPGGCD